MQEVDKVTSGWEGWTGTALVRRAKLENGVGKGTGRAAATTAKAAAAPAGTRS